MNEVNNNSQVHNIIMEGRKKLSLSGVTDVDRFDENTVAELKEETPLQRLGTPKNIADAVAFLVSDKAEFITGQVLAVNGGFVI